MSVFTSVSDATIRTLLAEYDLTVISATPADAGIENSNYLIRASRSGKPADVVLTLFEQLPPARIDWCLDLLDALAEQSLPVPQALPHPRGRRFMLHDKPAVLVPWLPGSHPHQPDAAQCEQIGQALARIHQTPIQHAQPTERQQLQQLLNTLPDIAERQTLRSLAQEWLALPVSCVVHGDLFRDNTLFDGAHLSGLLDFYQAALDHPAWDVAVAINDWCLIDGQPNQALEAALLAGYQRHAPALAAAVIAVLPLALVIAALRFWLSRREQSQQVALAGVGSKDPAPLHHLLLQRLQQHSLS